MFASSRRASAATIRAKSDRMRTASSGNSASCRSLSAGILVSFGFIGFLMFFGKHDDDAQYRQPDHCHFGRVGPQGKAQRSRKARAGYRMLANAAVWPQSRDAFLDAIVYLMQRVAQVVGGVLYLTFDCGVVYHSRLTSPVRVSAGLQVVPGAPTE